MKLNLGKENNAFSLRYYLILIWSVGMNTTGVMEINIRSQHLFQPKRFVRVQADKIGK